jgi:hypothetical protein
MSDPDIAPPALRRQLRLIVPVALANTVANGMLWPVLPQIVLAELRGDASRASLFLGTTSALNAALDLFANPLLGAFSDVYGRRLILLQSLAVSCACNLCVAASPTLATIVVAKVRTRRTVRAKSQSEFGSCTPVRATGRLRANECNQGDGIRDDRRSFARRLRDGSHPQLWFDRSSYRHRSRHRPAPRGAARRDRSSLDIRRLRQCDGAMKTR